MKAHLRKVLLFLEFILIFAFAPIIYFSGIFRINALIFLNCIAIICLILLLTDKSFEKNRLWNSNGLSSHFARMTAMYFVVGGGLFVLAYAWQSSRVLWFVKEHTRLWAIVMVIYPLLSVYPQEIIYRAFLFHRYDNLFPSSWAKIIISAAVFGYMHLVFGNIIAVLLTIAGGMIFAVTYESTKSLFLTSLEHALYGWLIFTAGLGQFFFHGTLHSASKIIL